MKSVIKPIAKLLILASSVFLLMSCGSQDAVEFSQETEKRDTSVEVSQEESDSDEFYTVQTDNQVQEEEYSYYDLIGYGEGFSEFYTEKEYVELVKNLKKESGEDSLTMVRAISKEIFFVQRTIDTYDKYEKAIATMDINGNLLHDWDSEWDDISVRYADFCGGNYFIETKMYIYDYYDCDIVNSQGIYIGTMKDRSSDEIRYDLGQGYVFFTEGFGQILTPDYKLIDLKTASVWPSYDRSDSIGQISDGLFYAFSKGNVNTVAYYYNTAGDVIIDLSTQAVNFQVTKLSDFSDGKAEIQFIGANGKNYRAYIDKTGEFIGEPEFLQ